MSDVFFLAFLAALYPSLLAATTVMLMLPHPKRLLLGYLLGAAMTSVTLGLVIVFAFRHSGLVKTTQTTLGPDADIVLGCLALAIAVVLGSGRDQRLVERRRERKAEKGPKGPPRWQQALGRGSARTTFVVGALLTLPGATYITALYRISDENLADPVTVAVVLAFNVIMLMLLEIPLLAYTIAPDWTPKAVERFKLKLRERGRTWAVRVAAALGLLMIARGLITLLV
ncbi:MAG TPA: GAP family protein [Solirubrobacterales bacterium]|nr:GAP family protein [Solirubrobacterales bacterium]